MRKQTYIIAEIGNTHEGSLGLAKKFIESAKQCSVDCVKFQTHIFEAESLPDAPNPPYFKDETRKEYLERTSFSFEKWCELKRFAEIEMKMDFISSPFSMEAVDLLENVGVKAYKIPSGEVTNIPLLEKIGKTGKEIYLSSGMSSWSELDEAVHVLLANGTTDLTIMQCTSKYPCPPEHSGLNVIREMKNRYKTKVGYSDHTIGLAVPIAAVVMGAVVIEKHFTLSKQMYGSDAINATEPDEFKYMVDQIRQVEIALTNNVDKNQAQESLKHMKTTFEKSIVASQNIKKGTTLSFKHFAFKKPGDGLPSKYYTQLIGKKVKKDIKINHKFRNEDFLN